MVSSLLDRLRWRLPASAAEWLRAGALCVAALAIVLAVAARALAGPPRPAGLLVGRPAPVFALPAERDGRRLAGSVSLAAERGHPVVLVFFYTLCAHCLSQVQAAATVARDEAGREVAVLYVNSPAERPDIVSAYLARLQITAPALLDTNGAVAARYGVRFYPTVVLVDGRGVVRGVWLGETGPLPLAHAIAALA